MGTQVQSRTSKSTSKSRRAERRGDVDQTVPQGAVNESLDKAVYDVAAIERDLEQNVGVRTEALRNLR